MCSVILDNCPSEEKMDKSPDTKNKIEIKEWYGKLLKTLENRFPNIFDRIISNVVSSNTSSDRRRNALRSIMTYMMSESSDKSAQTILENLYHPNLEFRLSAVTHLVENIGKLSQKDKDILQISICERILDEDLRIVRMIFNLKSDELISVLGEEKFMNVLVKLLNKCYGNSDWIEVTNIILQFICTREICKNPVVLLAVLPFLFPTTEQELITALKIMKSDFVKQYSFLAQKIKPEIFSKDFSSLVYYAILRNLSTQPEIFKNLDEDFKAFKEKLPVHKYMFSLLISANLEKSCAPELAVQCLNKFVYLLPEAKTIPNKNNGFLNIKNYIAAVKKNTLPLQGILGCLECVIEKVKINLSSNWLSESNATAQFLVKVVFILVKGIAGNECYTSVLKMFLNKFFPDLKSKIEFLLNFIILNDSFNVKVDVKTQLRVMNIIHSLLSNSEKSISWTVELKHNILIPTTIIGLINSTEEIRILSIRILEKIANCFCANTEKSYIPLLQEILKHKAEIYLDADQLPLILYTIFMDQKGINGLKILCDLASDDSAPLHVNSLILKVLSFINTIEMLEKCAKFAVVILNKRNNQNIVLDKHESLIIYNIILRINNSIVKDLVLSSNIWEFINLGLRQDKLSLNDEKGQYICPSVLIVNQITREVFENFNLKMQNLVLNCLIEIATFSENPEVASAVNKTVKKLDIPAKYFLEHLNSMKDVKSDKSLPLRKFRRVSEVPTLDVLDKKEWKQGLTALEFIQDKKKLQTPEVLLSVLFGILKKCLDFDEQNTLEYPKQIILSAILHICNKLQTGNQPLPKNIFTMELVVQCIRASQNPQTHHHALLLLAYTANLIPEQVLHNIMAIFTFMGSSVLRHDDAYSFQIITKIIDTIIPILVTGKGDDREQNVASVLRVFVDVILDIPVHRRLPLFQKLLQKLGAEEYLWLFLVLVFEAHVLHGNDNTNIKDSKNLLVDLENVAKRLDIALTIILAFPVDVALKSAIKLLEYIKTFPADKEDDYTNENYSYTFNIKQHTQKQFRHYKYTLVTFLSNLLSSKVLINSLATLKQEELFSLEPIYKNLIINILTYIQHVSKSSPNIPQNQQSQYWKVLLHHCYDIMDSINALLTTDMFVLVVRGLIVHNIPTVRRKAMEILNTKLQYQPNFFYTHPEDDEITDMDNLLALIPSIINVIESVDNDAEMQSDHELIQQTALLSLKLLIKLLAIKSPEKFVTILDFVTDMIKSNTTKGNILASLMLCLAELCNKLRAHAIPGLVRYMPAVIKILKNQKKQEPGLLLLCIITALQKILESLPLFLSPYLEKIIIEITILSAKFDTTDSSEDAQKLTPFIKKLEGIRTNIGNVIPSRILIPLVNQTYTFLIESEKYVAISPLMNILSTNVSTLKGNDLSQHLPDLTSFFMNALQFRTVSKSVDCPTKVMVEDAIISALSTLVLKLSETTFRPFYYKLFDWATRGEAKTEKVITFYRLSTAIAQNLKGLFVLFAGHCVQHASSLLDSTNVIKHEHDLYFTNEKKNILVIESVIRTLHSIFQHDNKNFVDKDRFETLMQPMVDQLENILGGVDKLTQRSTEFLIPCIAQFAVVIADDAFWKQLNYQILLKTRHNLPAIRLIGLNCLCAVAKQLKQDFLPLLPETVPFLAELLEDEEDIVEKSAQTVIQEMEGFTGEPLQKYF